MEKWGWCDWRGDRGPACVSGLLSRRVHREIIPRLPFSTSPLPCANSYFPTTPKKMATAGQIKLRGRPAHTEGSTYCTYTPDGSKLVTVGSNNTIRIYTYMSDGEPTNIDDCQEQNLGVTAAVR